MLQSSDISGRKATVASNAVHVGLLGQVIVLADEFGLAIHDGVTPGGHRIRAEGSPPGPGSFTTLDAAASGDPLRVNSLDGTTHKVRLQDVGVTKGYIGAGGGSAFTVHDSATAALLFDVNDTTGQVTAKSAVFEEPITVQQSGADAVVTVAPQSPGYAAGMRLTANDAVGSRYNNIASQHGATMQWQLTGDAVDGQLVVKVGAAAKKMATINANGMALEEPLTVAANGTYAASATFEGWGGTDDYILQATNNNFRIRNQTDARDDFYVLGDGKVVVGGAAALGGGQFSVHGERISQKHASAPSPILFGQYDASGNAQLMNQASAYLSFGTANQTRLSITTGGIIEIKDTGAPTVNPVGGGFLYVQGGALYFRGSSGTITLIAPS